MALDPRVKGKIGEQEVAILLNAEVAKVLDTLGATSTRTIRRNLDQCAIGGHDLVNPFGLAIEVKRREVLDIPSWWGQTVQQAAAINGIPVLFYRQNRKAWRVVTLVTLPGSSDQIPGDIHYLNFLSWFRDHITAYYHTKAGML